MTDETPYTRVPAFSVTYRDGLWTQTPDGLRGEHLCMSYDEAWHSIAVQGDAYVDGAVCMALRQALGVVPDAAAQP
jgi:hypothetical protein